jgi:hypothetical protein
MGCRRCLVGSPFLVRDILISHVLVPSVSNTYPIAVWPSVPSPGGLRCYDQFAVTITLGTLPEASCR